MELNVSVPHPHATLLLSPAASMPKTVIVIAVVMVELDHLCRCRF